MYTTLLIIHILGMIMSVVLMSGALALGASGKRSATKIATMGIVTTLIGGFTGIALMLSAPFTVKCAILTAYLLSMVVLYKFGFAMGNADRARLIRRSAVVQDN